MKKPKKERIETPYWEVTAQIKFDQQKVIAGDPQVPDDVVALSSELDSLLRHLPGSIAVRIVDVHEEVEDDFEKDDKF